MTEECARELGEVLLDYVERFGLTPKAREYFIRQTKDVGSKRAVKGIDGVEET